MGKNRMSPPLWSLLDPREILQTVRIGANTCELWRCARATLINTAFLHSDYCHRTFGQLCSLRTWCLTCTVRDRGRKRSLSHSYANVQSPFSSYFLTLILCFYFRSWLHHQFWLTPGRCFLDDSLKAVVVLPDWVRSVTAAPMFCQPQNLY